MILQYQNLTALDIILYCEILIFIENNHIDSFELKTHHCKSCINFPDISCYSNVMKFHVSCTIKVPGGIG